MPFIAMHDATTQSKIQSVLFVPPIRTAVYITETNFAFNCIELEKRRGDIITYLQYIREDKHQIRISLAFMYIISVCFILECIFECCLYCLYKFQISQF